MLGVPSGQERGCVQGNGVSYGSWGRISDRKKYLELIGIYVVIENKCQEQATKWSHPPMSPHMPEPCLCDSLERLAPVKINKEGTHGYQ